MAQLEARGAHNPEVTRSKRVAAKHFANVFHVFREVRVRIDSDHKFSFLVNKIRFVSGDSFEWVVFEVTGGRVTFAILRYSVHRLVEILLGKDHEQQR